MVYILLFADFLSSIIINIMTTYIMSGMVVNGFTSVNLPTLEKRFEFTGKELGLIASSNEVSQIILVGFISYYGSYGNKVKWIGYGCLLAGKPINNRSYQFPSNLTLIVYILCRNSFATFLRPSESCPQSLRFFWSAPSKQRRPVSYAILRYCSQWYQSKCSKLVS